MSEVSEMAPKGVSNKQRRAALDSLEKVIRQDMTFPGVTKDTPEDEKYMESGSFFTAKYPDAASKAGFYLRLNNWLQNLGADMARATQARFYVASLHDRGTGLFVS